MKMLVFFFVLILANANAEHDHDHDLNHQNTVVDRSTGVRLPLVRRDKLATISSPYVPPPRRRPLAWDFGKEVQYGSSEYYVTLGVGTPPIDQTLAMDTGSDLTWIQCQPCNPCFPQPGPTFDPTKSHSLSWVPCNSDTCNSLRKDQKLSCDENQCGYEYRYEDEDETYTIGSIASENLTIGGTTVPNVPMGCANDNNISFNNEADGLLGLGWGSLSLVSHSSGIIGGAFSFCLGYNDGWLTFGRSGSHHQVTKWALLMKNLKYPTSYYINVLRVEVDGTPIDIPGDTFRINPNTGEGGVFIDTGTTITQLPEVAYNALRDEVKARLDKLFTPTTTSADYVFDTCYRLGSGVVLENVQLPRISFIFPGMVYSSIVQLNATNVLVTMDTNITCFAFARSTSAKNAGIIGNLQMQGVPITIDASAEHVGFGSSNAC